MMKNNRIQELEAALERIQKGTPQRIQSGRKLSISAVQAEAGLGVGSIYHYPEFVDKVKALIETQKADKTAKAESAKDAEIKRLRAEVKEQKRIKEKYRDELKETKGLLKQSQLDNRELAWALHIKDISK